MSQMENGVGNGHEGHINPSAGNPSAGKARGRGKKGAPGAPAVAGAGAGAPGALAAGDSSEAKLLQIQARMSQLEQEHAGEKDHEAEIEREVKRAHRELNQQIGKLDTAEKIELLLKRCSELLADLRRATRENKTYKTRADNLQKEKDLNRSELSRTVGLKDKMEKLCRELQKDNNKLKSDYKALQNTTKDQQNHWDNKYGALVTKLDGRQEDKYNPPKQEIVPSELDELFQRRFKSFIDQYELRELHFHSQMRTKELEVQYNSFRYEREKKRLDAEVARVRQLELQVAGYDKSERDLRQQLNVYIEKFKQVEDTLNNSNDLFLSFRKEMEDMGKKTKKLEKENDALKRKHESTGTSIVRMAEEHEEMKQKTGGMEKKLGTLRAVIRQMQQQGRPLPAGMDAQYIEDLANGIERADMTDYCEFDGDDGGGDDGDANSSSNNNDNGDDNYEGEGLDDQPNSGAPALLPSRTRRARRSRAEPASFGSERRPPPQQPPQPPPATSTTQQPPSPGHHPVQHPHHPHHHHLHSAQHLQTTNGH